MWLTGGLDVVSLFEIVSFFGFVSSASCASEPSIYFADNVDLGLYFTLGLFKGTRGC